MLIVVVWWLVSFRQPVVSVAYWQGSNGLAAELVLLRTVATGALPFQQKVTFPTGSP